MACSIDIRNITPEAKVTEIRFADQSRRVNAYTTLNRQADLISATGDNIKILESGNGDYVRVWTADHARDLIRALEKAIELGMIK